MEKENTFVFREALYLGHIDKTVIRAVYITNTGSACTYCFPVRTDLALEKMFVKGMYPKMRTFEEWDELFSRHLVMDPFRERNARETYQKITRKCPKIEAIPEGMFNYY